MSIDEPTLHAIARYLDGELAGDALAAFEQRVRSDPALQAELESQRFIGASLIRSFDAPALSRASVLALASRTPAKHTPAAESHTGSSRAFTLRRLGIAAVLVAGLFGSWLAWQELKPDPTARLITGPQQPHTAAEYYSAKVSQGFEPDWVCADAQQFAATFGDRFGQPLAFTPDGETDRMLGLAYTAILSPRTVAMLGKSGDHAIIVLIDRLTSDNKEAIHAGCGGLNVHRREIGPLVAYELSPLTEPKLLGLLSPVEPSAPPPTGG